MSGSLFCISWLFFTYLVNCPSIQTAGRAVSHKLTHHKKSQTLFHDTNKNATNINCCLFCWALSKSFAADFLVPSAFFAPLRSRTITSTLSSVCTCRRWKHRMVHGFDLILSSEPAPLDSQNMLGATHTYKHTLTHVFAGVNVFMLYQVFPTTGWGITQSRVHLPKLLSSFEQLQLENQKSDFSYLFVWFWRKKTKNNFFNYLSFCLLCFAWYNMATMVLISELHNIFRGHCPGFKYHGSLLHFRQTNISVCADENKYWWNQISKRILDIWS